MSPNKQLFMEQLERELGVFIDETRICISAGDILRLNNEISECTKDNQVLLNNIPAMAGRFPCR